ncbi:MAG: CHAT domain-containing protein [Thermodesulfobacteriota bacterium]
MPPLKEVARSTAEVDHWSEQLAQAKGDARIIPLIRRGEIYRSMGYYEASIGDFNAALAEAEKVDRPVLAAVATQGLGYVFFLKQDFSQAEPLLQKALNQSEVSGSPILIAACANHLGTLRHNQGRKEDALQLYHKALKYAQRGEDPGLTAGIHRNLARVVADPSQKREHLIEAESQAIKVDSISERIDLFLGIAAEAEEGQPEEKATRFVHDLLKEALALSTELKDERRMSQAAGRFGKWYEEQNKWDEAYQMTEQALSAAQQLRAHDLLLRWEWQLGRLLRNAGDRAGAMAAYRRAVFHIESIRQDIPIQYQDGRSSFRDTLAPIYLGLADMLLLEAAEEESEPSRQALLREAQRIVERIKRSELTDYFRDPCISALSREIASLASGTAVLYPIILPDRLELLLEIDGRLTRKTAPVDRDRLETIAIRLSRRLRNLGRFEVLAGHVHEWLIDPVLPELDGHKIETLVYVPDGVLRLLPVGALYDGNRYLIERLAVVTVPGLTLLDPAPLPRQDMAALLAGMSEPGPVVFQLPDSLWTALRQVPPSMADRGVRGLAMAEARAEASPASTEAFRSSPEGLNRVKQALALPGVNEEINQLSKRLSGKVLLNESFQLGQFSTELRDSSYRVVHIASHGFFGGAPEENFIMTYDQRLDMSRLGGLIRPKQLADQPVELIALSACQTAEGDDRSPLGLTGVVLKSGARSALGSLWPVSDAAAKELFPAFYEHLIKQDVSKAEALRQAQLKLMRQKGFGHPFYWSPFILVGNWL